MGGDMSPISFLIVYFGSTGYETDRSSHLRHCRGIFYLRLLGEIYSIHHTESDSHDCFEDAVTSLRIASYTQTQSRKP